MRRKAAEEAAELAAKEAAWRAKMEAMNDATAAANMTLQVGGWGEEGRVCEGKQRGAACQGNVTNRATATPPNTCRLSGPRRRSGSG